MINEFSRLQQTNLEKYYRKNCCISKKRSIKIAVRLNMTEKNVTMWFISRNADEKMKQFPKHSCSSCKGNHQFLSHSEGIGTKRCIRQFTLLKNVTVVSDHCSAHLTSGPDNLILTFCVYCIRMSLVSVHISHVLLPCGLCLCYHVACTYYP